MKQVNSMRNQIIKWSGLVALILVAISGCTKYKEFEAVFPPDDSSLNRYRKIVIENPKPDDELYQKLENAIKTQLTLINPRYIAPAKGLDQIEKELKLFNYDPKIDTVPDNKTARLSYSIKATESINRDKRSTTTMLRQCNYLKKNFPCTTVGTATLNNGHQDIKIILSGLITLKDSAGQNIIPEVPFNQVLTDSGRLVESPELMIHKGVNAIAYHFASRIVPHREKIKTEILKGGDSVAVLLIENNALNLAINRLDRIVSNDSKPEVADLYNLGLAYEMLNEYSQSLLNYQRAADIKPNEEAVNKALKRIRRIVAN